MYESAPPSDFLTVFFSCTRLVLRFLEDSTSHSLAPLREITFLCRSTQRAEPAKKNRKEASLALRFMRRFAAMCLHNSLDFTEQDW
jgi:hypothetical protein